MAQSIKRWSVAIAMLLLMVFVFSNTSMVGAEEDSDYSFYAMSSSATAYLNKALSPDGEGFNAASYGGEELNAGDAASFVGYVDEDLHKDYVTDWVSSESTNSSSTISYEALYSVPHEDGSTNALMFYCQYGYMLSYLGLDEVGGEYGIGRQLVGWTTTLAYVLASSVNGLTGLVINVLQTFNPFLLFGEAINAILGAGTMEEASGALSTMAGQISDLYVALYELSWAVMVPLFFAAMVISFILFNESNKLGRIKKYVIRIVFLVIGVPVLGMLYTATLDSMEEATASANAAANKVVASTFVDFQAWAEECRLAVPPGATLEYDQKSDVPTDETIMSLRETALSINYYSGVLGSPGSSIPADISDDGSSWNDNMMDSSADEGTKEDYDAIMQMLEDYRKSAVYSPSDWESEVKSTISGDEEEEAYKKMVEDVSSNPDGFDDSDEDGGFESAATGLPEGWLHSTNVIGNGGLTGGYISGTYTVVYDEEGDAAAGEGTDISNSMGLSTLGMYNYLGSEFTETAVTSQSAKELSSDAVVNGHFAVTMVGSGVTSVLYWINMMAILCSTIVLGYAYAFSLIGGSFRRGIGLITSVPFAILGSMAGIAKVVTYGVIMVIEVIATVFLYSFSVQVMSAFGTAVEGPIFDKLSDLGALSGTLVISVGLILSTLCIFIITKTLLKVRTNAITAMNEGAESIINKFLDTNVDIPSASASSNAGGTPKNPVPGADQGAGKREGGDDDDAVKGATPGTEASDAEANSAEGGNGLDEGSPNGENGSSDSSESGDVNGEGTDSTEGAMGGESGDQSAQDEADSLLGQDSITGEPANAGEEPVGTGENVGEAAAAGAVATSGADGSAEENGYEDGTSEGSDSDSGFEGLNDGVRGVDAGSHAEGEGTTASDENVAGEATPDSQARRQAMVGKAVAGAAMAGAVADTMSDVTAAPRHKADKTSDAIANEVGMALRNPNKPGSYATTQQQVNGQPVVQQPKANGSSSIVKPVATAVVAKKAVKASTKTKSGAKPSKVKTSTSTPKKTVKSTTNAVTRRNGKFYDSVTGLEVENPTKAQVDATSKKSLGGEKPKRDQKKSGPKTKKVRPKSNPWG